MSYFMEDSSSSAQPPGVRSRIPEEEDEQADVSALVESAQKGSQKAFEILFERYNNQICRYLSRMVGNDGVGCELAQETFFKAWTALPRLRTPASFTGWLYRIATNCAYDYLKHVRNRQEISWEIYQQGAETLGVEGPERRVEEMELLRLALARVSLTYRPSLILYVIEELPQRQIAELLRMKETCVSKYVSRGKDELRRIYCRLLEGQGGTEGKGGKS
ncbi:MAG: sigma-70 family RNA polymerase sigma factor [Ktedonobacteraceae bacterium]|nr:sigma-70 family RNA polymerase sigma factor [Ktedonobacteraceae bacterium]